MSAPVDVLAVLEDIAEETRGAIGWPGCRELANRLDAAHAAIAELIGAAIELDAVYDTYAFDYGPTQHSLSVKGRMAAALARCGGTA